MAGRHFFPLLNESDIGPDSYKILPIFSAMHHERYRIGMPAEQLVKQLRGKNRVCLDAPPGARKSVDVPAALLRGGISKLVVHAVPGRTLAASLHNYVATLHSDVQFAFVGDFDGVDSFPEEGVVLTSTSVLAAYMCAWRAAGRKMGFALFLDEVHESDFATVTLRRLQSAAPGVDVYVEATATHGAGKGGSFPQPTLPGAVNDYHFQRVSAGHWDMYEKGKPWSLLKTTGDFLVFEDDPMEAGLIVENFAQHGVRAFRLTARTTPEEFLRTMRQVENPEQGEGVAALVVDYSYRSGFTFPTVTRIIDPGEVRYIQFEKGRAVVYKRDAYHFEIYQARNRGGRIEGVSCDYWCAVQTPQPVSVMVEGVEADVVCLLTRMLGFKPDPFLKASPFFAGLVPRQFNHVICSTTPLRSYKIDCAWPGEDRSPPEPEPISPLEADFPVTPQSNRAGDACSVYTVDEDSLSVGSISEEKFTQLRARASHVRQRPPPRLEDPDPVPRLDKSTADGFDQLFASVAGGRPGARRDEALKFGTYYYAAGLDTGGCTHYLSFEDVLRDCGQLKPDVFLRNLPGKLVHDIAAQALRAYNDAVVMATAANFVMGYVSKSDTVRQCADEFALREWATEVRGEFMRSNGTANTAMDFLRSISSFKFLPMAGMGPREAAAAESLLALLSVGMHDEEVERGYLEALPQPDFNPSGRYHLDIKAVGWRSRLALAVLGSKDPGMIELAARPVDQGGTVPVHTTASELALAAGRP